MMTNPRRQRHGRRDWILGAVLAAGACQALPETPDSITLETVNGQPVTLADAMNTFSSSHEGHGALVRGEPAVRELAGRVAERLLFMAEAKALGLDQEPDVVAAVDEHAHELVSQRYLENEVSAKVKVTDEEVAKFYDRTDVALRLTFMRSKERATAERLRERVLAGEDFGDLARAESIDESRSFGGLMPTTLRGQLEPEVESVVFALEQPGTVTPVIETKNGFVFTRLEARQVNTNRPPREVALPQIRSVLENRAKDARHTEVMTEVRSTAQIAIHEDLLTKELVLSSDQPTTVVATSAGQSLTLDKFRSMLNLEAFRTASDGDASKAATRIVHGWCDDQAVEQAAIAAGLMTDPTIQRQVEAFRQRRVLDRLIDRYVWADVKITEDAVRAYYESHPVEFTRPVEIRLAHILTKTEDEARALLARLNANEDFATLARANSTDKTSAMHGGKVGWVKKGDILPEVEARAFDLPVATIDGPVQSSAGFHLLKVLERHEAVVIPYEAARRAAEKRVLKLAQQEAYDAWAKRIKERADIEYDEDGIRRAVAHLEREAERAPKPAPAVPSGHEVPASMPSAAPVSATINHGPQPKD